jgi:hypothetical protein
MEEQDLLAETKSNPASVFTGAEKWDKNPVHKGGWDTASVVGYFYIDLAASSG